MTNRRLEYKGFTTTIKWDEYEEWFTGVVENTGSQYCGFGGVDTSIEQAFHDEVDQYLESVKVSRNKKFRYVITKTIGGLVSAFMTCEVIHYLIFGQFYYW